MCALPFSPPKAKYTPPPVANPDPDSAAEAIRTAEAEERRRLRLARGREATILTGPLGTSDRAAPGGKTLLGQ
jgi:hypothetical protein